MTAWLGRLGAMHESHALAGWCTDANRVLRLKVERRKDGCVHLYPCVYALVYASVCRVCLGVSMCRSSTDL